MLEFILFVLGLTADQLVKLWSMRVLAQIPGNEIPIFGDAFALRFAINTGQDVSFFRGTHWTMYLFRLAQLVLVLFILIKFRKKLSRWTRAGLALFLAGLVGNQINYLFAGYVPDMFYLGGSGFIFNVADVLVLASMAILFVRLAFFEGAQLVDWALKKFGTKRKGEQKADPPAGEPHE